MTFKQVAVVVEGQCERDFLQSVVAPMLGSKNIFLTAAVIGKPGHKGGNVTFERLLTDVNKFFSQGNCHAVSMMIDYFRLHPQWPGLPQLTQRMQAGASLTLQEKAQVLNTATLQAVQQALPQVKDIEQRFIPYIQMHEYEALLFSEQQRLAQCLGIEESKIQHVLAQYETPEHINTNPQRAPAEQIKNLINSRKYRKRRDGIDIAQKIGLSAMRQQCWLFNAWVEQLECA